MQITSAVITNQIIVQETKAGGAPGSARQGQIYYVDSQNIQAGVNNGQIDQFWDDTRTILATGSVVADPVTAPTLSASGADGSIAPGTYYVSYSYYNAAGLGVSETKQSPQQSVVVGSTNHISVTAPALPGGATGIRVYVTSVSGAQPQFAGTAASNTLNVTTLPSASALFPQPFNSTSFTSDVLNLSGGLTDDFGDTFTTLAIKSIMVKNLSNTDWLVLGGNTAGTPNTFWFDQIGTGSLYAPVGPGGIYHRTWYGPASGYSGVSGWRVLQAINDKLVINATGNSVNSLQYAIVLGIIK